MKKCPHCHEDSFNWRELVMLDYFYTSECTSCGKLVRNDGRRQLLMGPAILAALAASALVTSVVPESLSPFVFVLLTVLFVAPVVLLPKPVKADRTELTTSPFAPDAKNDKVILVSGWNEDELRKILGGFDTQDNSGAPSFRIELHKQYENSYRLNFPEDIHPTLFASLLNYLLYPIEIEILDRSITVVGKATLNSAFEGIAEGLFGEKAVLYVPEDDEDHDVVYLQTGSGINLANSFTESVWRPVPQARMPGEVKRLALQA